MENEIIYKKVALEEKTSQLEEFLKKVPLFSKLADDDLKQLCTSVTEEFFSEGQILFEEGDIGNKAFVIMEGEIEIFKDSAGRSILLATHRPGAVIGEMSLLDQAPRNASGRAKTDSKLLAISHEYLDHLLDTSPSAARVMLSTITNRLQTTEIVLRQSEKMAQLGTMTAGIAHELNNPASAARRGAEQLRPMIELVQNTYKNFQSLGYSESQWKEFQSLIEYASEQGSHPIHLSSLDRSDREEEVESWLDSHGIDNSWELAPTLVSTGYEVNDLDTFLQKFPGSQLKAAIEGVTTYFTIYSLLEEIHQGTSRIGEIVKSLKSYVYLDQAPVQLIDVHEGLDNTLVMLRSKLKTGIVLEKKYAEKLPRIQAHGSELNQVWTNLIDNAVDAMDGKGTLTIKTRNEGDWIFVDVIDTGSGISKEVQQKLFSPFFTTKPLGKGTGLGLNISFNIIQKHKGDIKVNSRPGYTCFTVSLPVNFEEVGNSDKPIKLADQVTDDHLRKILETTKTIAVVGISERENAASHIVPLFLQSKGYKIIPVNPNYETILNEKSYPELINIESKVDVVLIFRPSEFVPEIVDQAIKIGAKVVWMQEGIVNIEAASLAKDSGLDVVMDLCMRKSYLRLIEG